MPETITPQVGKRKVTVGALGGAIATILVFVLQSYDVDVPDGLHGVLATAVTALAVYVTREHYTV